MVCPKYNKSAKPYDKMTFATLKGPFQYWISHLQF